MATAVHLGPATMDWVLVDCQGGEATCRPSWDSSQALISLDSSASFIKVCCMGTSGKPAPSCAVAQQGAGHG